MKTRGRTLEEIRVSQDIVSRQKRIIFSGTFDDVMKYNTARRSYMRLLPISSGHSYV